ncbi:carbohydrate-binding protein [Hymenobacter sp. RP-2-7]|uniref:Carbohydrate-binding protein n=1 Tax=Hymenobacter polaris TaxID=2682546 RepID=A0A7Y0FLB5_9BACT|nr:beta-1,3-glucanase family protein [Hymenobacter polaris]NML64335.1 carbohydrate-binding protein [Hymenobacter polaris]
MHRTLLRALAGLLAVLSTWLPGRALAQGNSNLPFTINNNSTTADADLYVAIVGINTSGDHVWVNAANSQVLPMSASYNTVTGPTVNGNTGPGGNSKYAACFTRLSNIPNRTFALPFIAGCRVYISRGQQLYFYFFGANGAPSGYTAPNPQNASDPNTGIIYETIELTNNSGGFFGNTTRVDAFNYPMGLELTGNNYYKKTGELKSAADIVSAYKANVPTEFQGTVNSSTGVISFPSKTPAFYDGSNGTAAGQYGNYFKSYLDAIWAKYKSEDLIFNAGNAGVFKGRVGSDNRLVVVGQSGAYNGRTGIITREPTTQEAFEGKGVLAQRNSDGDCDLVVQAQITAAVNRHAISTASGAAGQQDFYNVSRFYQTAPMNYYARFWHLPGISVDNLSYGFAYDDVADQSSTLQTPQPTKVLATWGGFAGQSGGTGGVATFYKDCNYGGTAVSLPAGTYTLSQLQAKGIANDDISSLQVSSGYSVTLYADDNFGGAALGVTGNNSCLVNNALGAGNWNDQASSLKIQSGAGGTFSKQLEAEAANVNNGMQVETCSDTGGGQDMGYIDQGDYLVWNSINFPTTGTYLIEYRVASGANGGTISADLNAGNIQFGNTSIPGTGGWQSWTTVSKTVTINAGTYNFGIYAQTGGYNLNWVRISKQGTARVGEALATASAANDEQLALYPNPTTGPLTLAVAPALAGRPFRLLNTLGQVVRAGQLASGPLDVSSLPGGLYLLSVPAQGDQPALLRRFTKQ